MIQLVSAAIGTGVALLHYGAHFPPMVPADFSSEPRIGFRYHQW